MNSASTATHALVEGSPTINAGNPAAPGPGACETTDQRNIGRPIAGQCDMGAFEGSVPPILEYLPAVFK